MVTVGYERLTSRRMTHQTAGGFVAKIKLTLPHNAPMFRAALDDPKLRR